MSSGGRSPCLMSWGTPRFAILSGMWNSLMTEYVSASSGFSRAALWLPTPMPMPNSSAAMARFLLMSLALPYPPVIADMMIGASSFRPKTVTDVSISSRSTSGSGSCTSRTSSQNS